MPLYPRQLEAFRKVMVAGNMTTAAELLKISQPAVSRLIRDLEESLGMRLFRREGNRLIPGSEAHRLFREVDRFYQGMEQIEKVVDDLKSVRVGSLRIASIRALGMSFLSPGIQRFSAARPGISISLDVRPSLEILELIAANQIDVGFIGSMGADYPGVDLAPIPSVPAVCILPRGHALARKKSVQITDLAGQPLISLGPSSPLRMRLELALDAAGVVCQRSVETTHAHTACSLVACGLGLAVVDPFTAADLRGDAVARPLLPTVPFEFAMAFPSHQPRSRAVDDFVDVVTQMLSALPR